jgi:GxxExxY protein
MHVACEISLPIICDEIRIDAGYRIDIIVGGSIIIENKTVEKLLPIHEAQLLIYLKMKDSRLVFLVIWNVPRVKDGIKMMVNYF